VPVANLAQHKLTDCTSAKMTSCDQCRGEYQANLKKKHSCIKYVLCILKEAIGSEAFNAAENKV